MAQHRRLRVRRFSDAAEFGRRAEAWLLESEAEHNLLLGLVARLTTSRGGDELPLYFCTIERGEEVHGCAFRTPPHKLGITRMPDEAMPLLVEDVAEVYDTVPAVLGPEPEARRFASLWTEKKGVPARAGVRQRIYQVEMVTMPERPAPGGPRLAVADDLDLLVKWTASFVADTGMRAPRDSRGELERRVSEGHVWLWEDGSPRSMAGVTGHTPRGARVGYVYTPPAWRGRGYASACVAHVSQQVLESGRRFCFLYTDLGNPTSNSIYQRIGYEPVCDVMDYDFG